MSTTTAWALLLLAGICEIVWASALKASEGLTRGPTAIFALVMSIVSFGLLALAMKNLPIGTSYAIWTGIGAVGATVVGILWWGESASPARLTCVVLVVAGMIGLKLTS